MNVDLVEKKITKKTKALLVVHMAGFACDMNEIQKICKKHKLQLIEDCAHGLGTFFNRKHVGNFGVSGCFSFYPTKHITTGEGGMIVTNKKDIYEKCKSLRNLSFSKSYFYRYNHDDIGWNYRMTNMQAALGCGQLKSINKIVKRKREIGNLYYKYLKKNNKILFQENKNLSLIQI